MHYTANAISMGNMFSAPNFQMEKVPNLWKYWRGGRQKTIELVPGESVDASFFYKQMRWNQGKYKDEKGVGLGEYQHHKGVTRYVSMKLTGHVGFSSDPTPVAGFTGSTVYWQVLKSITAHRESSWGVGDKRYLMNPGAVPFNWQGVAIDEGQPTITAPVQSRFLETTAVS